MNKRGSTKPVDRTARQERTPVITDQLNPKQFGQFRDFIYKKCGIRINDNKLSLLSNRIRRRLRDGQFPDFDSYYAHVTSLRGASELEFFLDAITTNETSFFRTTSHFDWLKGTLIPEVVNAEHKGKRERTLRFWSAGCASGAEPYTIAICMLEEQFRLRDWSFTILGTDISMEALRLAREGVFRKRAMEGVSEQQTNRYFQPCGDDRWKLGSRVRELVTFEQHNLLRPIQQPPFDCIFIRNVLIYFDRESKQRVIKNLIRSLAPSGYLVVGPSEGIFDMLDPLERKATFLYRKPDEDPASPRK